MKLDPTSFGNAVARLREGLLRHEREPKDDQIRDHVTKNKKAFGRADVELIHALYPPARKMRNASIPAALRSGRC